MHSANVGSGALRSEFAFVLGGAIMAFAVSAAVTRMILSYAVRHRVLDVPGARSSHSRPVPLGGGIAIALTVLCGALMMVWGDWLPVGSGVALIGGGGAIAALGWRDDRGALPVKYRLLVQLLVATIAVVLLGGFPTLDLGSIRFALGSAGIGLAVLTVVWMTNLYNFMDGSDGLAGIQAICAGLGGAAMALAHGAIGLGGVGVLVAAASGGFLLWNWSPARIFMGDAGSCFLGFSFALLAFVGDNTASIPALAWMLLLAVFVCDATLTLLWRIARGVKCSEPHREHAYQRLIDGGVSHRQLALGLLLINVLLLWPMVLITMRWPALLPGVIAVIYALLAVIWYLVQRRHQRRTRSE